jgi:hypothetical protein
MQVWRAEDGAILVEAALGIAAILTVTLPYAALTGYATQAARDLSVAQGAAREAARTHLVSSAEVSFTCGAAPASADATCVPPLLRGSYVAAAKDTAVALPFNLVLHTSARAVARVE